MYVYLCMYVYMYVYLLGFIEYLRQAEKPGKEQAILTLRQYMCICTHWRTVDKIAIIGGDFK